MSEEYDALCSKSPCGMHVNINGKHIEGGVKDMITYLLDNGVKTVYFGGVLTLNESEPLKKAGIKVLT